MALQVLLKKQNLTNREKELNVLREKRVKVKLREEELATDVEAAATEEEMAAVEAAVEVLEQEKTSLDTAIAELEKVIADIKAAIEKLEAAVVVEKVEEPAVAEPIEEQERKGNFMINTRGKYFGMSRAAFESFTKRDDVVKFLGEIRAFGKNKRSVTGAEVNIPLTLVEMLRENMSEYSKVLPYINLKKVKGDARQPIAGTIPEAVWTEACGKLNELTFNFYAVETDSYKVAGFVPVCNSTLADSDINLATELMTGIGRAIGYALDKTTVYGLGVKMPLGIVRRLAQTTAPADQPQFARPWVDLHTSNIITIGTEATPLTGLKLFQAIIKASGAAKGKYSRGNKVWFMNEATHTAIIAESLAINSAGAIVSGVNSTMPAIGGDIVELDFMVDGDIVGGYGDLYLLAERGDMRLDSSEHVMFIEDNTVFRGVARYDGEPSIAEGFVAMNIAGKAVTTSVVFAADAANA